MPAGTLTLTNNSVAVTGSGTSFTSELKANDFIVVVVGGVTYTLGVQSVNSATSITLTTAYGGPTTSGLAWNAVANAALVGITAQIAADVAKAIRGLNLDKANWQQVFSASGNITVNLPDGTQYSGPSWANLSSSLSSAQATANAALPKTGGSMTGPIAFDNITVLSATVQNLGLKYIANDRFSVLVNGNREFQIVNATAVITTNASGDATITYATAFTQAPRVVAISGDWAAMNGNISTNNQNTTYFQVRCYKADGSIAANQSVRVDYIAMGRLS